MYRACSRTLPLARRLTMTPAKSQVRTFCGRRYGWSPLVVVEDTMKHIDQQFNRLEREMESKFRNFGRPTWSTWNRWPVLESEVVSEGNPSKYTLNINIGEGFNPENVKVTLKDRVLTVDAKGETQSEDGSSRFYQEVHRKFTLPENIDLKELKSILGPDGILKVEAPLPQVEGAKVEPKEIPIVKESSSA